jgi:hypothetical protein
LPWLQIDSDIRHPTVDTLQKLYSALSVYDCSVAPAQMGEPDNSEVFRIERELERLVPAYGGIGLRGIRARTPGGFFTPGYGDDFGYDLAIKMLGGLIGSVAFSYQESRPSRPPHVRAAAQEFGDGLMEGLVSLYKSGELTLQNGESIRNWLPIVRNIHEERRKLLFDIQNAVADKLRWLEKSSTSDYPIAQKIATMKKNLGTIRVAITAREQISDHDLALQAEWIKRWLKDLPPWNEHLASIQPASSIEEAFEQVGLGEFCESFTPEQPLLRSPNRRVAVRDPADKLPVSNSIAANSLLSAVSSDPNGKFTSKKEQWVALTRMIEQWAENNNSTSMAHLVADPKFLAEVGVSLLDPKWGRSCDPSSLGFVGGVVMETALADIAKGLTEADLPEEEGLNRIIRSGEMVRSLLDGCGEPDHETGGCACLLPVYIDFSPGRGGIAVAMVRALSVGRIEPEYLTPKPLFLTVPVADINLTSFNLTKETAVVDTTSVSVDFFGPDLKTARALMPAFVQRQALFLRSERPTAQIGAVVDGYPAHGHALIRLAELTGGHVYASPPEAARLNESRRRTGVHVRTLASPSR